jgi:hypothetical protein
MVDQFKGVPQPGAVSDRKVRQDGKPEPDKSAGLLSERPIGPPSQDPYMPSVPIGKADRK